MKTFEKLIAPLQDFLSVQGNKIDIESRSKSLFFNDFTLKMIYGLVKQVGSLRLLITELETAPTAFNLGFLPTPYSTFRDGFNRFSVKYFKQAFIHVLKGHDWVRLKGIDEAGIIKLVDGSLFPTLTSMCWATYKKHKNAIRLHLEMDLNTMAPTEFLAQKANSSERSFLLSILQKGYTYVADRGYFSFEVGNAMKKAEAFFIIRVRANLLFTILSDLPITSTGDKIPACFGQITDRLVRFDHDGHGQAYRLVCFTVLQSRFSICTNRFGLTTLQIIMLYAYRWQVELMFKFIKRTLKGIHLFNHTKKGVSIYFYLIMIVVLLKLRLKQICQVKTQRILEQGQQMEDLNDYFGVRPEQWIRSIAKEFHGHWKISKHWIRYLYNFIDLDFDEKIIRKLAEQ